MLATNAIPISAPADGRPGAPSTTHVRSLVIRLDGITAADYLAWVWDPEPAALDDGLRSVAVSAAPVGELVNIEPVWAGQPPTTPRTAAAAAGFALPPRSPRSTAPLPPATRTARRSSRAPILSRLPPSGRRVRRRSPTTSYQEVARCKQQPHPTQKYS